MYRSGPVHEQGPDPRRRPPGVHEGTGGSGSARPADARRGLNEGRMTVAGYRPAVTHLTAGSCVDGRTPRVACDRRILVLSLLSNATGHQTKLSSAPFEKLNWRND